VRCVGCQSRSNASHTGASTAPSIPSPLPRRHARPTSP
jgi:hypothetical protein